MNFESTIDANKGTSATSNVPMAMPRAKCGKISDKIELACGICVKIQIETIHSNYFIIIIIPDCKSIWYNTIFLCIQ